VLGTSWWPEPVAAQPAAVTCQGHEALESMKFKVAS